VYVTWSAAAGAGRSRILAGTGVAILVLLGILVTVSYARSWRAARREGPLGSASTDPPAAG
jgi:hypothetical protein